MKGFLEFKCRRWIFGAGAISFLNVSAFTIGCGGGGSVISYPAAITGTLGMCSLIMLFWLGVFRLCNPPRPEKAAVESVVPVPDTIEKAVEQPLVIFELESELRERIMMTKSESERTLCKV
jgi:hypothetical protein